MAFSGGAPAVVSQVFDAASQLATSLRNDAKSFLDSAKSQATTLIAVVDPAPLRLGSAVAPLDIGQDLGEGVTLAQFLSSRIDLYTGTYINRIFPVDDNIGPAQQWVARVLAGGVSLLDETVEERIWTRDRDRAQREAVRGANDALTSWAARGYALPPGAAVGAVLAAQRTAMEQAAASSREIAIKKFDVEIEQMQRAIDLAIRMRVEMVKNMAEYIKVAALGTMLPLQAREAFADMLAKVKKTAIDMALAQVEIAKTGVEVQKMVSDSTREWKKFDYEIQFKKLQVSVDLATAGAQMAATQAAAALNGLHASANIGGTDSTSTSYDGGYIGV